MPTVEEREESAPCDTTELIKNLEIKLLARFDGG